MHVRSCGNGVDKKYKIVNLPSKLMTRDPLSFLLLSVCSQQTQTLAYTFVCVHHHMHAYMNGHIVNTRTLTQAKMTLPSVFSVTVETDILSLKQ